MPPSPLSRYPDGHVLYRRLAKSYPKIVRGEGCWLYDDTGKRYLDASSGALVSNLGHGNAGLAKAIGEQAARVGYVSGVAFTNDAVEELAHSVTEKFEVDLTGGARDLDGTRLRREVRDRGLSILRQPPPRLLQSPRDAYRTGPTEPDRRRRGGQLPPGV